MASHVSLISNTAGVILAGGKSRRFGSNKALACLNDKPVIQHVADIITSLFSSCLVVTNTPEEYEFLELPMTGDIFQDAGPLAGIHAALSNIDESQAFVTGCDMPFIEPTLIRFLCSLDRAEEYDCVVPWLTTGPEPLCALYHRSSLSIFEDNLRHGLWKITENLAALKVRQAAEAEILGVVANLRSFHNINRPEDIREPML